MAASPPSPPTPTPQASAASVNRADLDAIVARWAFIRLFTGLRRPRVNRVGLDVAGVVEAAGEEVTRFKVGDRVFGDLFSYGSGAFDEYVAAPETPQGRSNPQSTAASRSTRSSTR